MEQKKNLKTWLRRLGIGGFLFFLGKGIVWLLVIFGAFKAC